MKNDILKQIQNTTRLFIEHGISITENHPIISGDEIIWSDFKDISFTLRNESYSKIYFKCLKEKAFNVLLLDGAFLQLMYRFKRDELIAHRLAFYPNPEIERYQDNPDDYNSVYYGNELFVDMIDQFVLCSPIRFDYDNDPNKFKDVDHPYSHLTIGNYKNCRIAVNSPISPHRFIRFILRNFYFNLYAENFKDTQFECDISLTNSITKNEEKLLHINYV